MKRRTERNHAFILIFHIDFHEDFDVKEAMRLYFENNPAANNADMEFISQLFFGVCENKDELDSIISSCSEGWTLNRMSKTDIAVLRLATYELKYLDTPVKVTINEAVELSKKFSPDERGAFVNGILAKIIKKLGKDAESGNEKSNDKGNGN